MKCHKNIAEKFLAYLVGRHRGGLWSWLDNQLVTKVYACLFSSQFCVDFSGCNGLYGVKTYRFNCDSA